MAPKTTWALVVAGSGLTEARLTQYLNGDTSSVHPTFDTTLAAADGAMRSRITTRYTVDSYDAWTSSTIPGYIRFHLESIMLGMATARDDNRPASIGTYADIAARWLDDVAAGKAQIAELSEIGSTSGSIGDSVSRIGAPEHQQFSHEALRRHVASLR